jgi:DNA-binding SARP family transcriptional activator/TolB-like protein
MKLKLFGGFSLANDRAEAVPVSLKRGQALLAYLASKESHKESREVLLDLLWPDRFKEQAQASLRQVLFELRALAGGGDALVVASRNDVALGPAIIECDLWNFETLSPSSQISDADLLLHLYAGPFLDGPQLATEPFQQWTAIQRSRLESQMENAVLQVTAENADQSNATQSIRLLAKLMELCPMCFQALWRLMELCAIGGDPKAAIRHFEHFSKRLKLEFGETPPKEFSDFCASLKTAPYRHIAISDALRQPAFVHNNPWTRTRSDAPVVAVLPFRYSGSRNGNAELAHALSEDITLMLSGCRWLSVLSRSATHNMRNDADLVPRDFARATGANHLVYGTITDRADSLSLSIELADAETGYITWAKRYDATSHDLMSWAGEVCPLIVAALDPAIIEREHRTLGKPALAATGCLVAYQHLVMGYRHYYAAQWDMAIEAFGNAIKEDATYAHAHAMLADTLYFSAQVARGRDFDAVLELAELSARRALEIDPSEAKANIALGQVMDWRGNHGESLGYLERAVALNPSFAQASTARSYHAVMTRSYEAAKTYIQTALRLRVGDSGLGFCLPSKALADLHMGNHREALQTAHWAMRLTPNFWLGRLVLATCLHATDDFETAAATVNDLKRDYRNLSADEFTSWFPYEDPHDGNIMRQALTQSGWR